MKKLISLLIILCMVMHSVPCLAEEYEYLAKETILNQEDIVEMSVEALSIYEEDSARYDFTTDDTEKIKAVLDVVNECRYFETKGVLMSESPTFLITFKYSDGGEISETFRESTVRIGEKKYRLNEEDYWRLEECIEKLKKDVVGENIFSDIAESDNCYEAVKGLSALGVMEGYDSTFRPNETLTRAEAAAIIVRLLNLENEVEQGQTNFTDVPATHWASGYVNFAEANGIINGQGDGTFAPDEFVTYHQLVKMLVCTLGYEPVALANGGWANDGYVVAAEKIGLVENEPENKDVPITRGEAAMICYNALDIDLMSANHGGLSYKILEGRTILTEYWRIDVGFVREFYFEKTFGFDLPEGAKCVEAEYWVENNGDKKCYMGKISFGKKDLDYIKENLEKQDFADGVLVEDSDVVYGGRHDRDAHLNWWDADNHGTQKAHYHWIKEDETVRYIHAVEFEAFIIEDSDGTYWLYVYKFDAEDVNI